MIQTMRTTTATPTAPTPATTPLPTTTTTTTTTTTLSRRRRLTCPAISVPTTTTAIKITNHRPQSDLESDHKQFLLNCQWANILKRFHEQATGAMYHSDQDAIW